MFYLPYGASELGRKPGRCDIVVRGDGYISGKHARALASVEHLEIIDLGSTNGTYVNNERVAPDQVRELQAGDTVRLGQTDLTVMFETMAAAGEPAAVDEEPAQPEPEAAPAVNDLPPADEPPAEDA